MRKGMNRKQADKLQQQWSKIEEELERQKVAGTPTRLPYIPPSFC